MAQSPEYSDLRWMPPRAWGEGRDGKAVRYIVIHYTAGAERSTSAEDGAVYDQHREDGTSTHYFVDRDSIVQCVRTRDRANAARHKGNRLGIQFELCGTAQNRAQWLDAASLPTLKLAAEQVARDCRKYGIPVRRLTVAETRRAWTDYPNGPKGIVGHVDCTNAYPEDGGDHTDPGAQFPWDLFLDMVRAELNPQEDDVSFSSDEFTLTPMAADALGKPAGTRMSGADLLQTMAIHMMRIASDVDAENLEVPPTAASVADAVFAKLGSGATPQQKADLLRAALGADAPAVGRLLAA